MLPEVAHEFDLLVVQQNCSLMVNIIIKKNMFNRIYKRLSSTIEILKNN